MYKNRETVQRNMTGCGQEKGKIERGIKLNFIPIRKDKIQGDFYEKIRDKNHCKDL